MDMHYIEPYVGSFDEPPSRSTHVDISKVNKRKAQKRISDGSVLAGSSHHLSLIGKGSLFCFTLGESAETPTTEEQPVGLGRDYDLLEDSWGSKEEVTVDDSTDMTVIVSSFSTHTRV